MYRQTDRQTKPRMITLSLAGGQNKHSLPWSEDVVFVNVPSLLSFSESSVHTTSLMSSNALVIFIILLKFAYLNSSKYPVISQVNFWVFLTDVHHFSLSKRKFSLSIYFIYISLMAVTAECIYGICKSRKPFIWIWIYVV